MRDSYIDPFPHYTPTPEWESHGYGLLSICMGCMGEKFYRTKEKVMLYAFVVL